MNDSNVIIVGTVHVVFLVPFLKVITGVIQFAPVATFCGAFSKQEGDAADLGNSEPLI